MGITDQIGIDIGTTYSRVSIFKDGRPQLLANELASNLTPSYVAYTRKLCHVGDRAREQEAMNPASTVRGFRRLLGHYCNNQSMKKDFANVPYKFHYFGNRPRIQVNYRNKPKCVAPEEVVGLVLEKLVEIGTAALGNVRKATITVPSQFTCCQRKAVKDAAAIVGIESELINETTAAALAYVFEMKSEFMNKERNLLVYNMGGGFTTATIIKVKDQHITVLSTAGDMLGGDDFDNLLADYCCCRFKKTQNIDVSKCHRAMCLLRKACDKAKRKLSFSVQTTIEVENICPGKDFEEALTRKEFEIMCDNLFKQALAPAEKALNDATLSTSRIDDIVLVGGSTRMPLLQRQLRKYFDLPSVNLTMNPFEAAVLGAAVHMSRSVTVEDVVPVAFGVENFEGGIDFVYQRNELFPKSHSKEYIIKNPTAVVKIWQGKEVPLSSPKSRLDMGNRGSLLKGSREKSHEPFPDPFSCRPLLAVKTDASGISYVIPLASKEFQLNKEQVQKIKESLGTYKRHRAEDAERILANDAKDMLLGSVERLADKLNNEKLSEYKKIEYCNLRNTTLQWLNDHADANSTEFESILDTFSKRVVDIRRAKELEEKISDVVSISQVGVQDNHVSKFPYTQPYNLWEATDKAISKAKQLYGTSSQSKSPEDKKAYFSKSDVNSLEGTISGEEFPQIHFELGHSERERTATAV